MRSSSLRLRWYVLLCALGASLPAGDLALRAAPAGTVHHADLRSTIPMQFEIVQTSPTTREFRYTHIISNHGDGPLEVRPEYDPSTDLARGFQRLYTHDASGAWSIVEEIPVVGVFRYHPDHGHYHYPLAQFGLFQVAANGSVGPPVTLSPKIGFCIGDSLAVDNSLPHAGAFGYFNACAPTTMKGISVGWGDLYDLNDQGQSIDATGVPDGIYWFHTIVDPFNYFVEKDKTNNITDIKLRIQGNTVTVLEGPFHPNSQPPAIALSAPAAGSVAGTSVVLSASASDDSGITSVQFLLDGDPIGAALTAPPYSINWDSTTVANGIHYLSAQATAGSGLIGTARAVTVNVSNGAPPPPPPGTLAVDAAVFARGTSGITTTPPFSTTAAGDLVVAFVASDGPAASASQTVAVSGAGLAWTLARRTNTRWGTSEIWTATASGVLSNVTVTSTQQVGSYHQLLGVVAFRGSGGVGATGSASAASGAPTVSLTATRTGSLVYAVGNDWDTATARVIGPGQTMAHEWVDSSVGDTFWIQNANAQATAGAVVQLNDTSPTTDQWNFTSIEITPAATSDLTISNVLVTDRTSSSAVVKWTTNRDANSRVDYGLDSGYGSTMMDSALVTSHSIALTGLSASTTYHYQLTSQDAQGKIATTQDLVFSTAGVSQMSCAITSPAGGSTVSGVITVTADAVGTASISGVQFMLDGQPLGAEDTLVPYAVSWDTTTASAGGHTLTAVARDPTNNSVTSAPVTVTVNNQPPPPPPPPGGLVAAYAFDEGSGTTASDASGNGNNGTLQNSGWNAGGRFGAALSLTGSGLVTVADAPLLDLTNGMTVEAWVRPTIVQRTSWRTVLMKERSGGLSYALFANANGKRPRAVINVGANDRNAQGSGTLEANVWAHIAATYDGASLRFYLNGTLTDTTVVAGSIVTGAGPLRIGGNTLRSEYFVGLIDNVRIHSRALTQSEIQSGMNAPVR